MKDFIYFKHSQCPICSGASKNCRQSKSTQLIFCRSTDANPTGFIYRGLDSWGFGMWTSTEDAKGFSNQVNEERERRQQEFLQAQAQQRQQRIRWQLSAADRHKYYQLLLEELTLETSDNEKLLERGFTREQIIKDGYKSVKAWQRIKGYYPSNLPGVISSNRLNVHGQGILCPIYNKDGLIVSCQIRLNNADNGRYRWLTSATKRNPTGATSHLNAELPLGVFEPESVQKADSIWLTEGTSIKPSLTRYKLNVPVIGAASGRFDGSLETAKEAVNYLSTKYETKLLTFAIDAGDVINTNGVPERWVQQFEFFSSLGFECRVAWWEQVSKEDCDIDELEDTSAISYITTSKFLLLVREYAQKARLDTEQNSQPESQTNKRFDQEDKWQLWRKFRGFTADVKLNTRYFNLPVPEPETLLGIRSGTGTGKTHWLINGLIAKYPNHGFLSLGYRNSLLLQFCALLPDWYHLQKHLRGDESILIADPQSKIAACLDSLIHFQSQDFQKKIVILDEVESIVKHLFHSETTIALHRSQIKELFKECLNRSSMVVLLDGHLKDETVKFIQGLMDNPKRLIKVENCYQGNKGKVRFLNRVVGMNGKINPDDYSPIIEAINNNSNNFAVVSDSQQKIEALDKLLIEQGRKTFRLDSTTSSSIKAETFLTNPQKFIQDNQIEIILYSPSAEAGLNIDVINYFSDIYVLFFGVITTDAQLQMIARIRDIAATISIFCQSRGLSSDTLFTSAKCPEDLARLITEYVINCAESSLSGIPQEQSIIELAKNLVKTSLTPHFQLDSQLTWIDNFERQNLRACLREGLVESGYQVEDVIGEKFSVDQVRQAVQQVKVAKSNNIANADTINSTTANKISGNIAATQEDKFKVLKFRLLDKLPGIDRVFYPPEATIPGAPEATTPEATTPGTPEATISRPIFDGEFVKRVLFDERRLISQIEMRFLVEHPEIAKLLQQKWWHGKLQIFTDPEKPDSEKCLNLTSYKSQWLKIKHLRHIGIGYFLQPGVTWCNESLELLELFRKGKKAEKYTGIKVGNSTPCEFLGRVLKSLGITTESTTNRKNRLYQVKPDDPVTQAIYNAVSIRISAQAADALAVIDWGSLIKVNEVPQRHTEQASQTAHLQQNYCISHLEGALDSTVSSSQNELVNFTSPPVTQNHTETLSQTAHLQPNSHIKSPEGALISPHEYDDRVQGFLALIRETLAMGYLDWGMLHTFFANVDATIKAAVWGHLTPCEKTQIKAIAPVSPEELLAQSLIEIFKNGGAQAVAAANHIKRMFFDLEPEESQIAQDCLPIEILIALGFV